MTATTTATAISSPPSQPAIYRPNNSKKRKPFFQNEGGGGHSKHNFALYGYDTFHVPFLLACIRFASYVFIRKKKFTVVKSFRQPPTQTSNLPAHSHLTSPS